MAKITKMISIQKSIGKSRENPDSSILRLTIALFIATLFVVGFNAFQLNSVLAMKMVMDSQTMAPDISEDSMSSTIMDGPDVIPKGIPVVYGQELGLSFDDISTATPQRADATIRKLGVLDKRIELSGDLLRRYIAVARQISCEYCCGAPSIITSDGKAACSCAHSFAMRGLAKYLLQNHSNEYTDTQILEELGKWKTLFFPGKLTAKAAVLKEKGIELNYINLASNKYRGIERQKEN